MKALLAIALALVLALTVACGDDDDDSDTPGPTSPAVTSPAASVSVTPEPSSCPAPSTAPSASPEPTPVFQGSRDPVEEEGPAVPPVAVLYDVRTACHESYDRIVFDFRDNAPGYRIEYVEPPISQDGSGEPLDIAGEAFLYVRFYVAQAYDEDGNSTYTGPREITPDLEAISEMEMAGDYEGYVTWGIGLPEELDFRVTALEDPYRVVIDIAHP
ncbi:MAG: hypothetical protein ABIP58_03560 [Dehalococcoidia bacterium]